MNIGIEKKSNGVNAIPAPPKPTRNDDVRPSSYIPRGMTPKERRALRTAGLEWAATLGGNIATVSGPFTGKSQAVDNMDHFTDGDGEDKELSRREIDSIDEQSAMMTTFKNNNVDNFLDLINDDFQAGSADRTQYLIRNLDSNSPNAGTNWFGMYSDHGTNWYFAMGGFLISYGALAVKGRNDVLVTYKMFIYDRYNWDIDKDVTVPGNQLGWVLNDGRMDEISGLIAPGWDKDPYFRRDVDSDGNTSYFASDSLLGALVESGDADNFDITGAGSISTKRFPLKASNQPTPSPHPPSATTPTQSPSRN